MRRPFKAKSNRSLPRRRPSFFKPFLEILEDRRLLSSGAILQGTVINDQTNAPQSGAMVTLTQPGNSSFTPQTQTTGANGSYSFTGLTPGTYQLLETPPSGNVYDATTANLPAGVESVPSTPPPGNPVTVTIASSLAIDISVSGNTLSYKTTTGTVSAPVEILSYVINGQTIANDFVGQIVASANGETTTGSENTPTFNTFCVDLSPSNSLNNGSNDFNILPQTDLSGIGGANVQVGNSGEIAYLYNKDGQGTLSNVNAAALQVAIWSLEYNATDPTKFDASNGQIIPPGNNFYLTGAQSSSSYYSQVVSQAKNYISDATGKSGQALFLAAGAITNKGGGEQGVIAPLGSITFSNVPKATPAINTTQQPASATVGAAIADTATVTGLVNASAGDTVTFNLYSNPNGTGTPLFTDTETVSLNGTTATATSAGYTTAATGTDYWVATFNGDSSNNAVTSGTALEPVTITPNTPAINTSQQPASATVGSSVADTATVTGLVNASSGDTVTFNLYSSATTQNSSTLLYTDTETVSLSGSTATATSKGYTTAATGTDYWVATFNGDSNNNSATSGATAEPVSITPATPAINTSQQPASATVGAAIADTATVTGLVNASAGDTVTFNLYSSATVQNSSTLLFSDTEGVTLSGTTATATSKGFTTTATGTDYWVATFNGDSNNNSVTSGTANEPVTVTPNTPAINTSQQPASATVGASVADQATVTGLVNASSGDTVTFNLYSSATTQDSTTLLFSDTETVSLSGGTATATSKGYTTAATGTDYWVATFNGDSNNNAVTSGATAEPVSITPNTPAINTSQQPASATVGSSVADTATVTGLVNASAGDTVTFNLYSNPNGTGTPLFTDTETVSLNGTTATATSKGYTTTATGTDYWVATFNGDSSNKAVTSGTALEPITITPNTPSINTSQQPASATVGSSVADQATVTGLVNASAGDTVTFNLYSSATTQNSSTLLFTDTETVSLSGGTATATSKGYTTAATGTDYWVATFNGDSNNNAVTSGSAAEPVTITPNTPAINTTQQPASATVGSSVADQATVTGLVNASSGDTVTFNLYSSATTQNSSTLLFTDTETVSLSGSTATATSKGYTTAATGTDYWVATFNGDSNNNAVTSGSTAEPVSITPNTPAINTSQQPASATVGSSVADTATVTGLVNASAGDTVTFNLYSNPNGTGTPLFTDTETVSLNGTTATATSAGYTTAATGTDYWVATFNGDSSNNAVTSGTALEPVTITPNTPAITTTQQPASATVGASVADKATVTGLVNASAGDTVTFNLYSSATTQNSTTLLFTDTETVSLSGSTATATSKGYTTTATGTDYWVASFNGDSNNNAVTSGSTAEPVTITPNTPAINTTQQPASATVGSSVADQATVTGLVNASSSDTVTFNLYSSATTQNSSTLLFSDTETISLSGSTATATSKGYTTSATGTDYWVATFNGDSNNNAVTSGSTAEPVTITPNTPSINTSQQPASATVGSSVADQATVTGLVNASAGDTVTFNLYSSATTQNSSTLLFTDTETVSLSGGTATATSKGYTTAATGTDYWVATFNGDSNNNSVTSGSTAEPVTINKTSPAITTSQQPASATVGASIADKATVTGLVNASKSDTVTFNLYSSATTQNSSTLLFTDTETVSLSGGTATATSKGFTTTATGTDYWVATFNGDSNNKAVTSGATAEPVTITNTVGTGSAATMGFWHNKNGQAVIDSFNGSSSATALGNWMASNFPNLFGTFKGQTNAQIAADFLTAFANVGGVQGNTYCQAFAVALAIYATDPTLGANSTVASYGFIIKTGGTGSDNFNIGSNGAAFGVANNTSLTVFQILQIVNNNYNPKTGLFYGGNQTLTSDANNVLNGINTTGDIQSSVLEPDSLTDDGNSDEDSDSGIVGVESPDGVGFAMPARTPVSGWQSVILTAQSEDPNGDAARVGIGGSLIPGSASNHQAVDALFADRSWLARSRDPRLVHLARPDDVLPGSDEGGISKVAMVLALVSGAMLQGKAADSRSRSRTAVRLTGKPE